MQQLSSASRSCTQLSPFVFLPVSWVNPAGGALHDLEQCSTRSVMAAMNSRQDANLDDFYQRLSCTPHEIRRSTGVGLSERKRRLAAGLKAERFRRH